MKRLALLLVGLSGSLTAQSGTYSNMSEYPISIPSSAPAGITAGPDGALWFAESGCYQGACYIGRITTAGVITEYAVPTSNSQPTSITAGPDGALWFTEASGQIGRITTAGVITEFPVPSGGGPGESRQGRTAHCWFTWISFPNGGVGRITTTGGNITQFEVPISFGPFGNPQGITTGPDHALWFADTAGNIWRLSTAGAFTQYPVPVKPSGGGTGWIARGADGALWFTVTCNPCAHDQIGRLTTTGVFTEFPIDHDGTLGGIARGPDGALWYTITGFGLSIASSVGRAPACALGFSASFSDVTLSLQFVLGIDTPAEFNVLLKNSAGTVIGDLISKPIPGAVPPHTFGVDWGSFPNLGELTVQPVLGSGQGQPICSEWATVNTAP